MDWNDQERQALDILRDPAAEENQWLAACQRVPRRTVMLPKTPLPGQNPFQALDGTFAIAAAFLAGISSIGGGALIGASTTRGIYALAMSVSSSSAWGALACILLQASLFGLAMGATRNSPTAYAGFRTGLLMPMFGAFFFANFLGLNILLNWLGTWAFNVPLLSMFVVIANYKVASHMFANNSDVADNAESIPATLPDQPESTELTGCLTNQSHSRVVAVNRLRTSTSQPHSAITLTVVEILPSQ